ncbi:MAG: PD-(D/E)XK nuclease family protein [Verrucomicrobiota bacterium]
MGPAERIDQILKALSSGFQSGIVSITVIDRPDSLPFKWRQLLEALGAQFDACLPDSPLATPGSWLYFLQCSLLGIEDSGEGAMGGTVRIVEGSSETELARAAAQDWTDSGNLVDAAIIAPPEGRCRLNEFLGQRNLPALGGAEGNSGGVLSQLLPLSLRLLWKPFDPQAWLEFLLHPVGPVPRGLRFRLARAINEMPGRDNTEWRRAIERGREKASDDPEQADRIEAAISDWFELPEYSREEGAPTEAVVDVVSRLARWMRSVGIAKQRGDSDAALSWVYTAQAVERFAGAIGRLERVVPQDLEKLVHLWISGAERGTRFTGELGGPVALASPDQVLESAPDLYWWIPTGSGVRRSPWTSGERDWLSSQGVNLVGAEATLEAEEQAGYRAVLQATDSLTLFVPTGPEGSRVAPIVTRILAELKSSPSKEATSLIQSEPIPVHTLPEPKRWWKLSDPSLLIPRESESFSSLSKAIYSPYQWLLSYQAGLEAGALSGFGVDSDAARSGTLLHELVGKLLGTDPESGEPQHAWAGMEQSALLSWIEREWSSVLAECGAQFLLPGHEAGRNRLRHMAPQALWSLVEYLQSAGVTEVEVEKKVSGISLGDGELNGRIDLVARAPDGTAVIDLKLGGRTMRETELRQNRHLQLAVYGHLLRETEGIDPHAAFFILRNAALLTRTAEFFPDAFPVSRDNEQDSSEWSGCWEEFLQVWGWRKAQFAAGLIEVTTGSTEPDQTPPLEHWKVPDGADAYNDFDALTGWPRTA